MKKRQNAIREGSRIADIVIYIMAAIVAFIALYPLYYVLILSLSKPEAAATMRVYWLPKGIYFGGYEKIFADSRLWISYRNTILYAATQATGMLVTCCTFAYALSVKKLRGRRFINAFILIPMYFSGGIIPVFLLILNLGLYNTPWALILPGCYSIWYIILVKAYFGSIPESLRESARIDGANHYQTLWSIYLPISKPILAVIALYTVVGVWNSWYRPALFLTNPNLQPLQLYLRRILVEQTVDLSQDFATDALLRAAQEQQLSNNQLKYTVIIVSSLPMIIAYPFFQRYFVKGVMLGSLKG
ncbi:carbohydrate ABC transporter permease [Eubacteriales bacterium OttesenSCG-928-A19]|nr:carbohydrate ABC transporter permease [Eubacteriales bacterium OttesenSCG-928-A19]